MVENSLLVVAVKVAMDVVRSSGTGKKTLVVVVLWVGYGSATSFCQFAKRLLQMMAVKETMNALNRICSVAETG